MCLIMKSNTTLQFPRTLLHFTFLFPKKGNFVSHPDKRSTFITKTTHFSHKTNVILRQIHWIHLKIILQRLFNHIKCIRQFNAAPNCISIFSYIQIR